MIFLNCRFTIPDFLSRLLSYMQAKLPVLAVTDPNKDIGKIVLDGGFDWWCESNDEVRFVEKIREIVNKDLQGSQEQSFYYLAYEYASENSYSIICESINRL